MAEYPENSPPPAEPPQYTPLPPPVSAATPPPGLPPPPQIPHASTFLDQFQLAVHLRRLRVQSKNRADNATWAMRLAALALVAWGLYGMVMCGLGTFGSFTESEADADTVALLIVLGAGVMLTGAMVAYGSLVLVTAGRVFPYHYRLAWQHLIHGSDGVLLADEERLRIIQENLPGRFWGAAVTRREFTSLAERLEFGAFHLPSLRQLARTPERPPRAQVRRTEVARRYVQYFNQLGVIIACCVGGAVIGWLQIGLLSVGLGQGPRLVQAYARLMAFIDFYLEEPQIDVRPLPPAPELKGWWAETTAPWFARL